MRLKIKKQEVRMNKKPELLAPAGTMDAIIAAVNGGADAVYFGGKAFNARRNAENMTEDEIRTAVALCHYRGVKVYVTLNILIKNSEFEALIKTLNFLKNLHVDGLIVQDMGVIYLIKHYFPEFKLQTSTQASVYGLEGVLFFQEQGFSRVVLPREMPLTQVAEIKKKAQIELKIFCHGALCYAYSGQCLMSSMIGGRSGNRGLCAQPCRKTYQLFDEQDRLINEGYLLSPKDLKTLEEMEAIVAAGVDALKIEGRMKTPEYVYGITRAYRERINEVFGEKPEKTINDQAVMQVFNRDFTRGHLFNEADILNPQVGKNRGVLIGRVMAMPKSQNSRNYGAYPHLALSLNQDAELSLGDGLSFGEDGKIGTKVDGIFTLDGSRLEKGHGGETIAIPCRYGVSPGTLLYKNFDKGLMDQLHQWGSVPVNLPEAVVDFKLTIKAELPVKIVAASQGIEVSYTADFEPEIPLRKPLDEALISEQISRLGATDFALGTIVIDMDTNLFLSRSQLNLLRKEVIGKLAAKITAASETSADDLITIVPLEKELHGNQKSLDNETGRKRISLEFREMPSREWLSQLTNLGVAEVVMPLLGEGATEMAAFSKECGLNVLLKTPKIMDDAGSQKVRRLSNQDIKHDGFLIGNYEALQLLKNRSDYLEADQSFNLFNTLAARALKEWQVKGGVLSPELDEIQLKEISEYSDLAMVLPVYGTQELMVSKKCLFNCANCPEKTKGTTGLCQMEMTGNLEDERGGYFPVKRDNQGLIHIYNRDTLFLREEILDLRGVDTWRIYHRNEALETMKTIINYYRRDIYEKHWGLPEGLSTAGTTRGSFKRGVK
ncbi:hypothetical protein GH810_12515 [Acetobacterium paludosum]|uniref:Peptidase U32 collagenase domain-containing protein n=2 Tax=Acetobacterium paludosum TaxID=52693 RepID=A0A923HV63_9FIRM|nr:hypothetical protein [Acetobacterium paludosum]